MDLFRRLAGGSTSSSQEDLQNARVAQQQSRVDNQNRAPSSAAGAARDPRAGANSSSHAYATARPAPAGTQPEPQQQDRTPTSRQPPEKALNFSTVASAGRKILDGAGTAISTAVQVAGSIDSGSAAGAVGQHLSPGVLRKAVVEKRVVESELGSASWQWRQLTLSGTTLEWGGVGGGQALSGTRKGGSIPAGSATKPEEVLRLSTVVRCQAIDVDAALEIGRRKLAGEATVQTATSSSSSQTQPQSQQMHTQSHSVQAQGQDMKSNFKRVSRGARQLLGILGLEPNADGSSPRRGKASAQAASSPRKVYQFAVLARRPRRAFVFQTRNRKSLSCLFTRL